MPVVTKAQALKELTNEIQDQLDADELHEVYDEIFPDAARTEAGAKEDNWPLVEQLVDHVYSGLEVEEIMDLWGLIFTRHRNVWYDDEEERIHYDEEPEAVSHE